MNFREQFITEGYNKDFGVMYSKAKSSKDIDEIHGNSDFIMQFEYKGTEYENTLSDSSTKGINKAFAKILNTNEISGTDADGKEVKNIKLSDASNFNYEVN
jgi:hypothetical protein